MRKEIILRVPPFSINRMYYSDLKAKTADAREWSAQVLHQLNYADNQPQLQAIREYFDPKLHAFVVQMTAFYPKEIFFNKEGSISGRTQDESNWEKPLLDLVFGPKYFDQPSPYGAKNVNHDDRYIYRLISQKLPHDQDHSIIKLVIKVVSLDRIARQI